jgi:hypothetical protein
MTTSITRPPGTDVRRHQEKQEDALLAAFRQMEPGERFKLVRRARLRRGWRINAPM